MDDETQRKLLEQEEHLHVIGDKLQRIGHIGKSMGGELDRQNRHLEEMTAKTDRVDAHMKRTTKKIQDKL